jgi:hypothetical protein
VPGGLLQQQLTGIEQKAEDHGAVHHRAVHVVFVEVRTSDHQKRNIALLKPIKEDHIPERQSRKTADDLKKNPRSRT